MAAMGRYVKLNIAATMCRTELCVVALLDRGRPLCNRILDRQHLHIVTVPEGTALVHHRVGNSGPFLCRVNGTLPLPCSSLPSRTRLIVVGEFPLQNSDKTMSS
jgi:hypothetical protein